MPDLIKSGAEWLARTRRKSLTSPIIYLRGASSVTVPASRGRIVTEVEDVHGLLLSIEQWTWIVSVKDLCVDGIQTTPQRGDRIRDGENGAIYEVDSLQGQSHWNWSDAFQTGYKIFTKLVEQPK